MPKSSDETVVEIILPSSGLLTIQPIIDSWLWVGMLADWVINIKCEEILKVLWKLKSSQIINCHWWHYRIHEISATWTNHYKICYTVGTAAKCNKFNTFALPCKWLGNQTELDNHIKHEEQKLFETETQDK